MLMRESRDTVLLAEQNDGLAGMILSSLQRAGCGGCLARVRNGQEALGYACRALRERDSVTENLRVIILDMDPPTPDSLEVVERLRSDPSYEAISLLVLSPRIDPVIEHRCRELRCHGYVSKWETLLDLDKFSASVAELMTPGADDRSSTPVMSADPSVG